VTFGYENIDKTNEMGLGVISSGKIIFVTHKIGDI
jgi:hypothetical protein